MDGGSAQAHAESADEHGEDHKKADGKLIGKEHERRGEKVILCSQPHGPDCTVYSPPPPETPIAVASYFSTTALAEAPPCVSSKEVLHQR